MIRANTKKHNKISKSYKKLPENYIRAVFLLEKAILKTRRTEKLKPLHNKGATNCSKTVFQKTNDIFKIKCKYGLRGDEND